VLIFRLGYFQGGGGGKGKGAPGGGGVTVKYALNKKTQGGGKLMVKNREERRILSKIRHSHPTSYYKMGNR